MNRHEMGVKGEDLAAEYLVRQGFELMNRNWRIERYEIDIVAEKEGVLHVIEVKSRKSGGLTTPEDAMTRRKFSFLCKAMQHYIGLYGCDCDVQFDLVAVDFDPQGRHTLRYIPDVMTPRW